MAQSATPLWTFVTGEPILASPSVAQDGTIYVGSYDRKLYSIHPDGSTNWSFEMPGTNTIGWVYRGIFSSPAIGPDSTVYFGGEDGLFYAVDGLTGSNLWAFDVAPSTPPGGGTTRFSAIYSDSAVDSQGTIYIGSYVVDTSLINNTKTSQSYLFALNPDGTVKWRYKPAQPIFSDPVIAPDGTVYFGCDDGNLYALDDNGSLRWTFPVGGLVKASPAIAGDGTIYLGSSLESPATNALYAANTNGTKLWSFVTDAAISSSAAIGTDGTVYFGSNDGSLYALNPDGSLKWSVPLGAPVRSSPALAADGLIYVGCDNGLMYALDAGGSNIWSLTTTNYVYSSPVIAPDGTVYVASADNNLYAVAGNGALADTAWPMFRQNLRRTGTAIESGVLEVTPADGLSSSGLEGGPFSPSSIIYTLTNSGDSALNWTASKAESWVSLSATGGALDAGGSTTVTVSINSGAESLAAGSYSDTVSFVNTTSGSGNSVRGVSLEVTSAETYELTVAVNNASWGTATPTNGTYPAGSSVELAATPATYFQFTEWSGDAQDTNNPLVLVINTNLAVLAVFGEVFTTNYPTPHWWLASHGYTNDFESAVTNVGANGMQLWQSYVAGLDPGDPDSRLLLNLDSIDPALLSWQTVSGRVYTVHWATNGISTFLPLDGATELPWTITSVTNDPPAGLPSVLYRLEVQKP